MIRSVLLIVNPISGRGRGPRIAGALASRLEARGIRAVLSPTRAAGDGERLAAAASGHDAVLAVGGDGTVNEVLSGLVGRDVPLGIVPLGTANVLAKEFGHSRHVEAACDLIVRDRRRRIDLIEVLEEDGRRRCWAAAVTGAGYDAHIVRAFHSWRRGPIVGHALYIAWGFAMMLDYRPPRIRVEADGRVLDEAATFVVVSNTRTYAGPLSFAPEARPDDGWLDVYRFRALGRFDYLRAFGFAMLHRPHWSGRSAGARAKEIRLTVLDGHVPMQVDGDPAGNAPARIRVAPGALDLLVPAGIAAEDDTTR